MTPLELLALIAVFAIIRVAISFRTDRTPAGPGIVGQFARDHGALVPDRVVTSAKSWLSNPHIDPKQRTLPWRSSIAEEKLSPFECSSRYLQHLKMVYRGGCGSAWMMSAHPLL